MIGLISREWKHKYSDYSFLQQENPGKKSFNTGVFNKKLLIMAENRKMKFGIAESTRAKYLLNHRDRKRRIAVDHHGKDTSFFSMAEDLPHHVHEMKVVASTGVPNSFFNNAFVKE